MHPEEQVQVEDGIGIEKGQETESPEASGSQDKDGGGQGKSRREKRNNANADPLRKMDMAALERMRLQELRELARHYHLSGHSGLKKDDLILRLLKAKAEREGFSFGGGILEVTGESIGFLRSSRYAPGADDVYVSQSQIRRFGLRTGDMVAGQVRPPKDTEKYCSLLRVEAVNGMDPELAKQRPRFERLTPIFPKERFNLNTGPRMITQRLLDLVAPVGFGQRGLIVSPPKAGKTTVLKKIANGISANHPDVHLMVCLIGERPEEVTDMDRSVDAEVISSTFDETVEHQTHVAEMALNRAKRLVEIGRDVVILMDSLTRLTRAYNLVVQPSGRTLSGGLDPAALYPPKRFFGAARNIEEGGSLTDRRHLSGRHRQPHGRHDLRGVQRHGQHGAPPEPQAPGTPHLPGLRHHTLRHAPRGAVAGQGDAAQGLADAPDDLADDDGHGDDAGLRYHGRARGAVAAHAQDAHQPRVPRRSDAGPRLVAGICLTKSSGGTGRNRTS